MRKSVATLFQKSRQSYRLAAAMLVFWAQLGFGQDLSTLFKNPDAVDISLITAVPGRQIYDNFGHTALRVNDHASKQDLVFNWGIFDFTNPFAFGVKFYRGGVTFRLGVYPYTQDLPYLKAGGRTTYEDLLRLTKSQKEILLGRLVRNLKPENIAYNYDYFYDNCATRPRDYLDDALGGALRATYASTLTDETYRDTVRYHYRELAPIDLGLDVLMNSQIDPKMSVWEKGFLPTTLRDMLLATKNNQIHEGGDSAPLVAQSMELATFAPPRAIIPSGHLVYFLLESALLSVFLVSLYGRQDSQPKERKPALRFLGLASLLYGLFFGLMGLAMPLNWLWLINPHAHHNANILFFWPIDLVYAYWGWRWLRQGNPLVLKSRLGYQMARHTQDLHGALAAFAMVLWATGIIQQDLSTISQYVLPPTLVLWLFMRRFGFTPPASPSITQVS